MATKPKNRDTVLPGTVSAGAVTVDGSGILDGSMQVKPTPGGWVFPTSMEEAISIMDDALEEVMVNTAKTRASQPKRPATTKKSRAA